MIDTDKYEGHTEGPWIPHEPFMDMGDGLSVILRGFKYRLFSPLSQSQWKDADIQLMADAPLLLAEVKRLRAGIKAYLDLEIETSDLKELIE